MRDKRERRSGITMGFSSIPWRFCQKNRRAQHAYVFLSPCFLVLAGYPHFLLLAFRMLTLWMRMILPCDYRQQAEAITWLWVWRCYRECASPPTLIPCTMLSEHLVWCVCVCPIMAEVHNSNTTCYGGLTLWKSFILWLNFVAKMSWKLVQCRTKKLFCRHLPLGWSFTVNIWLNFENVWAPGCFCISWYKIFDVKREMVYLLHMDGTYSYR